MKQREFSVIGLGRFGEEVVKTLAEKGFSIIAADQDLKALEKVEKLQGVKAVKVDSTDLEALSEVGLETTDIVVVAFRNFIASLYTIKNLKAIGIKEIIARAIDDFHIELMKSVGATRVIFPEKEIGFNLANEIVTPDIVDFLKLGKGYILIEKKVPEKLVGKKFTQVGGSKYGVSILPEIKKRLNEQGEEYSISHVDPNPNVDYIFQKGDIITFFGPEKNVEEFDKFLSS